MDDLHVIVGLGNPGAEYARTRHNAGFLIVDRLAAQWRADWKHERKFEAFVARTAEGKSGVLLCKPQTFMNASGESVGALTGFYRVAASRCLVIMDDADLPFGEIRMRPGGGTGGHHGLESIEAHLATKEFPRLRVGIGRKDGAREITGHVLGKFSPAESEMLELVLARAANQAECWVREGIQKAMNQFNGAVESPDKEKRQAVKRYEGLFILNTAGKEEGVNDLVEKIKSQLVAQGATIETVQKMEKKAFVRVADNKNKDGYYVNYIFTAGPEAIRKLQTHFALNADVFRTLFSELPAKAEAK